MTETRESIGGTVEDVVYYNEQNDYAVIEMTGDDGSLITAVGTFPYVAEGEELVLYGKWVNHPTYGRQFSSETFEKRLPSDVQAILRYLSSRAVRGIGPITAAKIVSRYGADTFEVIEAHPEWLADIPGISPKKAVEIHDSFCEQTGIRSVMLFCRDYLGAAAATRVYRRFGGGAVDLIKNNPYCLADPILGIGFLRADEIAASMGMAKDALPRILGGLQYVLQYNALQNGHSCLPEDKLIAATAIQLGIEEKTVADRLPAFIDGGQIAAYDSKKQNRRFLMLPQYEKAESNVKSKLQELAHHYISYAKEDADAMISRLESEEKISYAPLQKAAIRAALDGGVLILTGGPGTGKTTVVKALSHLFSQLGHRVALAAPTGRAAKRMSESSGQEAKTVHRLLEATKDQDGVSAFFNRNKSNPLEEDVIILDEASMLDLPLTDNLLRAVKNGSRVIFIGDADQLPSVGTGNVLCDLIASGQFTTVSLHDVFRQSENSLIVSNAHRINNGEMPQTGNRNGDFFFISTKSENQIAGITADLLCRRLPAAYGEDVKEKTQIVTPSRKGRAGTETMNAILQSKLNPPSDEKDEHAQGERVFRVGDRVMQIRNNYDIEWRKNGAAGQGVFNGDIGIIESIDKESASMTVRFDDAAAVYGFELLDELELAYAITVHKSQGSEYPIVIIPLFDCPPMLQTRNLLYTAVTRAKQMVILVGNERVLARMVENNRHEMRYTCLLERLTEEEG